mmetsp:Transcript_26210/g.45099  ORF Transcript_26210/g.45099 Transcript_26210/m.45099 type:complete len:200 (+) Transcript_26210:114-713(+)|eukprot:CAMPEP_0196654020 /NCGR_PEP_ID=MMETSP1086-20130531/3696_1 /TAXON_ID=77921 /ORGANISM="Cyanoptyche  gloeocystis , Strain SAG4.97" /LENGTH=199 /DNA_ID=CAMNT_0041985537 /DNA_START=124 /DNA_END=723 /DNA_ORIENTATION=+
MAFVSGIAITQSASSVRTASGVLSCAAPAVRNVQAASDVAVKRRNLQLSSAFLGRQIVFRYAARTPSATCPMLVKAAADEEVKEPEEVVEEVVVFSEPPKPEEETIDWDALLEKPKEILADAASRPALYAKNAAYVAAGGFAILLASSISSGFHKIPLLPSFFQLVGLGYVLWFAYRYLLFSENRKELMDLIQDFLGKL